MLLPKTRTSPMQIQVQNSQVIVRTYAWNNERWRHGIVRTYAWNNERWRHGIVRTYVWNNESCRHGHMGRCTCRLASTKKKAVNVTYATKPPFSQCLGHCAIPAKRHGQAVHSLADAIPLPRFQTLYSSYQPLTGAICYGA
jgi:hypothetical protein